MCISHTKHQSGCISEVLRKITNPRRSLGDFSAAGMDFCNHAIVFAVVSQRNRNAKVNTFDLYVKFGKFEKQLVIMENIY